MAENSALAVLAGAAQCQSYVCACQCGRATGLVEIVRHQRRIVVCSRCYQLVTNAIRVATTFSAAVLRTASSYVLEITYNKMHRLNPPCG